MSAASVIHQAEVQGRAMHALVIGVGDYPHLKHGSGDTFSSHEGMGQLTAAPISARKFAEWLIRDYHDPSRPVASVRLLLSEKLFLNRASKFKNPLTGATYSVPRAEMAEVTTATEEWAKALNANEEDLAIFFFSGHGVMSGLEQALLLSDFGNPASLNVRRGAIRFTALRSGMKLIAAREQCYFLDACRSYSQAFSESYGSTGEGIIAPEPKRYSRAAAQPVFNATLEGEPAFGREDEPSLFTDALLKALKGGGSDDRDTADKWRLESGQLNQAIEFLVKRTAERVGLGLAQLPAAEGMVSVSLGELTSEPLIPVALCCAPDEATVQAEFAHPIAAKWRKGDPDPLVAYGTHEFEVKFSGPPYAAAKMVREVRPPYRTVRIPVSEASDQ